MRRSRPARRDDERPDSDVDVLAILAEPVEAAAVEETLRDVAYDVLPDTGIAISVHTVTDARLDARADHPFFQTVLSEGRAVYG